MTEIINSHSDMEMVHDCAGPVGRRILIKILIRTY